MNEKKILEAAALHVKAKTANLTDLYELGLALFEKDDFSSVMFATVVRVMQGEAMDFRSPDAKHLSRMKKMAKAIGATTKPCEDFAKPHWPRAKAIRITPEEKASGRGLM